MSFADSLNSGSTLAKPLSLAWSTSIRRLMDWTHITAFVAAGRREALVLRYLAASLLLQRQLPLTGGHLLPDLFKVCRHLRVVRGVVQRLGKPAIGCGQIAGSTATGGVHCSKQALGAGAAAFGGGEQILTGQRAVLRNAVAVKVTLTDSGEIFSRGRGDWKNSFWLRYNARLPERRFRLLVLWNRRGRFRRGLGRRWSRLIDCHRRRFDPRSPGKTGGRVDRRNRLFGGRRGRFCGFLLGSAAGYVSRKPRPDGRRTASEQDR